MPIKPIDFQIMVPRTIEAAKITNDEAQRNLALLRQQATATQHKADDTLKTVYSRSQTQDVRITEKQRDDRQNKKKKKDSQKSEDTADDSGNKPARQMKTTTIDIKI